MEKVVKEKKPKSTQDKAQKIKDAYMEYVLEEGKAPTSVYKFMKTLRMKEATFYDYYASFDTLEKHIWGDYMMQVKNSLEQDETYRSYSAREKLLALYYTLIEVLKDNRSFVHIGLKKIEPLKPSPLFLAFFKNNFFAIVNDILQEAKETGEVVDRPIVGEKYQDALWIQLLFVVNFWLKDDSKDFVQTDAAIEKAVNLAFDLMGKSPIDSMLDFAKFLYHNHKN